MLGVVLLDSPVLGGLLSKGVQLAKAVGLNQRISPGRVSRQRRHHWPSTDAAHAHFAARWAPEVLRDYIACGVQPAGDLESAGQRLAFHRDIETTIYDTLPHHMSALLHRNPLRCPVAFVGGTQSAENRQVGLRATERLTHGRMSWIEGSHLFPFEQPTAATAQVLHWLKVFSETPESSVRPQGRPV